MFFSLALDLTLNTSKEISAVLLEMSSGKTIIPSDFLRQKSILIDLLVITNLDKIGFRDLAQTRENRVPVQLEAFKTIALNLNLESVIEYMISARVPVS